MTANAPLKVTIKVEDTTLKPTAVKFTAGDQLYTPTTVNNTEGSNLIKTFDATTNDATLNLSTPKDTHTVLDSTTTPLTKICTVTVDDDTCTIDFEAKNEKKLTTVKVKVPAGEAAINGSTFNGATALTLDTTKDGATLNSGTVNVSTNEKIVATDDELTAGAGESTITVIGGKITVAGGLDKGESFVHGGKTYTVRDNDVTAVDSEGKYTVYTALDNKTLDLTATTGVITLEGLASLEGITVKNNIVTLRAENLNGENVTLTGEGYKLTLTDDVQKPIDGTGLCGCGGRQRPRVL